MLSESQSIPVCLSVGFATGILLGAAYFGALYATVRRLPRLRRPGLVLLGSTLVRMAVLLFGFAQLLAWHWASLVACVLGFVAARMLWLRLAPFAQDPAAAQTPVSAARGTAEGRRVVLEAERPPCR